MPDQLPEKKWYMVFDNPKHNVLCWTGIALLSIIEIALIWRSLTVDWQNPIF